MFERFTKDARLVVTHAVEEAESRGDTRIGTEHLLIGVARSASLEGLMPDVESLRAELDGMDREALASVGLDPELIELAGPARQKKTAHIPFTSGAKDILKGALRAALDLGLCGLRPARAGLARPDALQRGHGHRIPGAHRRDRERRPVPAAAGDLMVARGAGAPPLDGDLARHLEHLRVERRLAERSLAHMRDAVRVNPRSVATWRVLGTTLLRMRRYPETREALDRALPVS